MFPTNSAAPYASTRAAVGGAHRHAPLYNGGLIHVCKKDLAVGDVFKEQCGWKSNRDPRIEMARITAVDQDTKTMQIAYGENEVKTINLRDLPVLRGPKIAAAVANPALLVYRGGRWCWRGEAVQV